MNEMMTGVKVKSGSRTGSVTTSASGVGALDVAVGSSLAVVGGVSAFIGLWSVVCLVSAMVTQGGPLGLITGWLTAVTGV